MALIKRCVGGSISSICSIDVPTGWRRVLLWRSDRALRLYFLQILKIEQ